MQEVLAERGHEKKGGRRQKMLQETKRRTAGQNMGAGKTRAGIEKRLESLTKDRQTRMGCGSQNGSKWTVGISSRCSKAHWFEAQSGTGPEKKARAVGRLQKQKCGKQEDKARVEEQSHRRQERSGCHQWSSC